MFISYLYVFIFYLYEAGDRHWSRQLKPSLSDSAFSSQQAVTVRTVVAFCRIFFRSREDNLQPQNCLHAPLASEHGHTRRAARPASLVVIGLDVQQPAGESHPVFSENQQALASPQELTDYCLNWWIVTLKYGFECTFVQMRLQQKATFKQYRKRRQNRDTGTSLETCAR